MKLSIKEPAMAPYARKEAYEYDGKQYEPDIQNGDTITIKNSGEVTNGQYGEQYEFLVETRNGDRLLNINQKSLNLLIGSWGEETNEWVGKTAHVLTKRDVIANKRVIVAYVTPGGYIIDEWGGVVKDEPNVPRDQAVAPQPKSEGQKQVEAAQEITPDVVPF